MYVFRQEKRNRKPPFNTTFQSILFFSRQKVCKKCVFVIAYYNKMKGRYFQQNKELNSHKGLFVF